MRAVLAGPRVLGVPIVRGACIGGLTPRAGPIGEAGSEKAGDGGGGPCAIAIASSSAGFQ